MNGCWKASVVALNIHVRRRTQLFHFQQGARPAGKTGQKGTTRMWPCLQHTIKYIYILLCYLILYYIILYHIILYHIILYIYM